MHARRAVAALGLLLGLAVAAPSAHAQPKPSPQDDFVDLIREGNYKKLAKILRENVDLKKCDPALRSYVEYNLAYLARGARPKTGESEIVLIRGARNDKPYQMPPASGGTALMLPNVIRFLHQHWDDRLDKINEYFGTATTTQGGDGKKTFELDKIITDHKGGGLGKSSNSVHSVLISTSTRPLPTFGPPFYVIKVPAGRAIFNYNGLSGEYEVLLPFWILPKEIVSKYDTYDAAMADPLVKASPLLKLDMQTWGAKTVNNWKIIEENVRKGRKPLEGVYGMNSYYREGTDVGPDASEADVARFVEKVEKHGGTVERVDASDPRLDGLQGRTYVGPDGKPKVLLPTSGTVKKFALVDELTHVIQLERAIAKSGAEAIEGKLRAAVEGNPAARRQMMEWEVEAKKIILLQLAIDDPLRDLVRNSIRDMRASLVDDLRDKNVPELRALANKEGRVTTASTRSGLISALTGVEESVVASRLETASHPRAVPGRAGLDRAGLDRDRLDRDRLDRDRLGLDREGRKPEGIGIDEILRRKVVGEKDRPR